MCCEDETADSKIPGQKTNRFMVAEKPRVRRVLGGLMKLKYRRRHMKITIKQAITLYKLGVATVGNDGKISFKKEKSR